MTTTKNNMLPVTGNTYPVRDKLKNLGCVWDAPNKQWLAPSVKLSEARAIVDNQKTEGISNGSLTANDKIAIGARRRGLTPGECSACGTKCKYPYTECWDCREERMMGY